MEDENKYEGLEAVTETYEFCTASGRDFATAAKRILDFYLWVPNVVDAMENATKVYYKYEKYAQKPLGPRKSTWYEWLDVRRQFLLELLLTRHVDNYLSFLSAVLFEIFTSRPDTLKSAEQVSVEEVLSCEDMNGVIRMFAERKVNRLAYKSYHDLSMFFNERLGLQLTSASDEQVISEAIELRNISVHNRCKMDRRYVQKTGRPMSDLGKIRELGTDDYERYFFPMVRSARDVDADAAKKFNLAVLSSSTD